MNRSLWQPPYRGTLPSFPCPVCQEGFLLVSADGLRQVETGESKRAWAHEAWAPEWMDSRFSALLQCNKPDCAHVVGVVGTVSFEMEPFCLPSGGWDSETVPSFTPMAFWEAPSLIRVRAECPEDVDGQLKRSFPLYWLDHGACANAIRATVEALLTERGVSETTTNKRGDTVRVALHDRIKRFQALDQAAAELLLAIKLLGNAGSHGDDVTRGDLLDAYEILDHVIDAIYNTRAAHAAKLASALAARFSP